MSDTHAHKICLECAHTPDVEVCSRHHGNAVCECCGQDRPYNCTSAEGLKLCRERVAVKKLDDGIAALVDQAVDADVMCQDIVKALGATFIAVVAAHFDECVEVAPTRERVRAVFEELLQKVEFDGKRRADATKELN